VSDETPPPAGDALPEDLDVTAYVGPHLFPDTKRRRIAGWLYIGVAGGALAGWLVSGNRGLLAGAILVALAAAYHFVTGWHLQVDQTEALLIASRTVGFPVGHSSAQMGWRGLRSRPSWRILIYSADTPPSMRGLVEVDGIGGTVLGEYTELNPEDWSEFGLAATEPG
jgi:hypothetical protein